MEPIKKLTRLAPQRRDLAPPKPTSRPPVGRDVMKPAPTPPRAATVRPRPGKAAKAAAVLAALCFLLSAFSSFAQWTTNPPVIRTTTADTYTTNAPTARVIGEDDWLPMPTFTGWSFYHLSNEFGLATNSCVQLTGLSWTNTARTSNGVLEVWSSRLTNSISLGQTFPWTNSVTNSSLVCSNLLYPWNGYAVKLRYGQGAYRSVFTPPITNTTTEP